MQKERTPILPCVLSVVLSCLSALAETPDRDASKLPPQAEVMENVLVPVPGEIFRTLSAFPEPNWQRVQSRSLARWKPEGTQVRIALRLGAVIAEGFIAVAAEDLDEVQEIGKAALTLARALGVERSILRRSNSILSHAERHEWKVVREEWSNVDSDVRAAMTEIDSEPLAQLVSLGGWLRGGQALTKLVLQRYSPESAAILYQPALLAYFEKQLSHMDAKISQDPLIPALKSALGQAGKVAGASAQPPISEARVRELAQLTGNLLGKIGEKSSR